MSLMFESNQVFRISKRSSINYPSLHPFVGSFEENPQKDNQEMVELKLLLESTTSLVDNLRRENSLIHSENQDIKETLMEYVKAVTDENKELKNEIKGMSVKMEKANQELLEKIEEKMRTLEKFEIKKRKQMNQSNYEVIHQQSEKKIDKKITFTGSQVFFYRKPSDQNQRLIINDPFNPDREEEKLDKIQPFFFPLEKRKSIEWPKNEESEINKSFDTFLEKPALNLKTEEKKHEEKNEQFCNVLELKPAVLSPFGEANLEEELFKFILNKRDLSYDKFDKLKKTDEKTVQKEKLVYGTYTGSCYHRSNCYHLHSSKVPTPLSEAKIKWRPCLICRPTP